MTQSIVNRQSPIVNGRRRLTYLPDGRRRAGFVRDDEQRLPGRALRRPNKRGPLRPEVAAVVRVVAGQERAGRGVYREAPVVDVPDQDWGLRLRDVEHGDAAVALEADEGVRVIADYADDDRFRL